MGTYYGIIIACISITRNRLYWFVGNHKVFYRLLLIVRTVGTEGPPGIGFE